MIPLVLHHGIFNVFNFKLGKFKLCTFSSAVENAIAGRGHRLIVSKVHPTAGIATRAGELKEIILRDLELLGRPNEPVILIAHSMGGLDARYMISCLGMAPRVAALVTISSPHRGNAFADWCQRHLGQRLGGFELARHLGLDVQAVNDLTIASCRRFNEEVPDSPGVRLLFNHRADAALAQDPALCAACLADRAGSRGRQRRAGFGREFDLGETSGNLAGGSLAPGQPSICD